MDQRKPKSRSIGQPRVQGARVPGSHPADVVIRRERYPFAAPSPVENLLYWLIGSPIASSRAMHERLTKVKALAVFSSDALSSVAYATEEILLVLLLAGAGAFSLAGPIGIAIALLLLIVAISYRQTIHAYPKGGGSYIVSKDNLGTLPGLVAGAALLIDYVLTVAVSISSGVSAIVSAMPDVASFRIELAVGFVLLITVANLRGIRESSSIFMMPTYAFIVAIFMLIASGLYRYFVLGMTSAAPTTNTMPAAIEGLGLFLILRAFAAGCTALTGVEAISDGVPAFKPPESQNAARTLGIMATILISMFLGITLLTQLFTGITPEPDHETVLSQLGRTVFGEGPLYFFLQAATALILVLAANTSFADFPRLAYFISRDGFLPHMFVRIGQRLVFTTGILALAFLSSVLIIVFGASTHNLIPLYAVGVFVSFTFSQAGMVQRWRKLRGHNWQRNMVINTIGAVATATVLLILAYTKFLEGAWLVVILIPILIGMFLAIHRHYEGYKEQVRLDHEPAIVRPNIIVVPVEKINGATERTLHFAHSITGQITAVHVQPTEAEGQQLAEQWPDQAVPLKLITSNSVLRALLGYLQTVGAENPDARVVVVVPERAPHHIWDLALHNQTALLLKLALLFAPRRIVVSVAYDEPFEQAHGPEHEHANIIVIPVARVDRSTLRTLRFASTIEGEKTAVFIMNDAAEGEAMSKEWKAAQLDIPLRLIESPYRSVTGPLSKYIDTISQENDDANVVVILPEIVPKRYWQLVLHNQTMAILKLILLFRPKNRILISVPYHLER